MAILCCVAQKAASAVQRQWYVIICFWAVFLTKKQGCNDKVITCKFFDISTRKKHWDFYVPLFTKVLLWQRLIEHKHTTGQRYKFENLDNIFYLNILVTAHIIQWCKLQYLLWFRHLLGETNLFSSRLPHFKLRSPTREHLISSCPEVSRNQSESCKPHYKPMRIVPSV